MSAHFYIADSGGTARKAKFLYIADAGGVARKLKKLYIADAGGVARLVYTGQGTYSGTYTRGTDGTYSGYSASAPFGSISPTSDSNGNTIETLLTYPGSPGTPYLQLSIANASFQGYFTTLTATGIGSVLASGASSFVFAAGVGTWQWDGSYALSTSGSWSLA